MASRLPLPPAIVAIGLMTVTLLWLIAVAPPFLGIAVAVGLAIAWCRWLERHADPRAAGLTEALIPADRTPASPSSVHVLATTPNGTRTALAAAGRLSAAGGDVVVFAPRLTCGTPFDPAGPEHAAIVDEQRALAAEVGVHVRVIVCVSHRREDVVHQMLGRSSLLVVGGRGSAWWPSEEQRLAARLTNEGYPVVFACAGGPGLRSWTRSLR